MSAGFTDNLSESTKELLMQQAPWREGIAWWVVLIQGVVALGLGGYILLRQEVAGPLTVQLFGVFLLVMALVAAYRGIRYRVSPRVMPYHMLSAGVGLTAGGLIALDMWRTFLVPPAGLVILSVGLLLNGIFGVWEWFITNKENRTWLALGASAASLLLGLMVLASGLALAEDALRWAAIVLVVLGVLLLGYTFVLYGRQNRPAPAKQEQPA